MKRRNDLKKLEHPPAGIIAIVLFVCVSICLAISPDLIINAMGVFLVMFAGLAGVFFFVTFWYLRQWVLINEERRRWKKQKQAWETIVSNQDETYRGPRSLDKL